MIINKDINPQKQVYYIGGLIMKIIKDLDDEIDFFDVLQKINEFEVISLNLYTLTIDWLFLLGVLELERGKLKKCL